MEANQEAPFSNREIREFFTDMKDDISEIKTQTKLTNGRVTALENYKWFLAGGLALLTLLVIPVILLLVEKVII